MLVMNSQHQLMLQQAIRDFQGGNLDSAVLILQKILQNDTNASETIFDLAIAFAQINRFSFPTNNI
jgi:Flp pilus assembly protein TadD